MPGGAGFSRSTLGIDLFISRWEILPKMAETLSLSRHYRLWLPASGRASDDRARPRRIAKTWRQLLRATAGAAPESRTSCSPRTQVLAVFHARDRWNGR